MSENCFLASVDLKDAYYPIPVAMEHRKYLCFIFKGNSTSSPSYQKAYKVIVENLPKC